MTLQTRKFDIAELLDTDKDIRAFLEDGTPQKFIRALNLSARAKDMTDIGEVMETPKRLMVFPAIEARDSHPNTDKY